MTEQKCAFDRCERVGKVTRGYCPTHYMRLLRHGDAGVVKPRREPGKRSPHFMYRAWAQMINRCHNPNNYSYGRYGARGVRVCDRWRTDFLHFLADMGERPDGMTLDRIDPTGDYEPANCRWATITEQRRNVSEAGDKRVRAATSKSKKEYWRKWRSARGLPPEAPSKQEYKARRRRDGLPV